MVITKKHLDRRTMLKGMGVTMALPLLEAMVPARSVRAQGTAGRVRFVCIEVPHGSAGSTAYGLKTNIVRNGRIHAELDEQGRSLEQIAADFDKVALTTADKAAEIIHRGVERGKARILVGPDAYVFDALARIAPTSYFNVMARLFER